MSGTGNNAGGPGKPAGGGQRGRGKGGPRDASRRNAQGRERNRGPQRNYTESAPSQRTRRADPARLVAFEVLRAVAQEESQHGVRANAVAPTSIRTATNLESMGTDAAYVDRSDVASTVLWLCSAEASAVTGQIVKLQEADGRKQKAGNDS